MQLSPIFKIKCHNILSLAPAHTSFSSFLKDRRGDTHTNFPTKPPSGRGRGVLGQRTESSVIASSRRRVRGNERKHLGRHRIELGYALKAVDRLRQINNTDGAS